MSPALPDEVAAPPTASAPVPCRCRPLHLGVPVDTASLNRATEARLSSEGGAHPELAGRARHVDCLVVPGFTPRYGFRAHTLHERARRCCEVAARDFLDGVAPFVIVSGAAVHGPANEAVLMREALLDLGVPADRILLEPCARHTTTNLRNAGRLMLAHRLRTAYVVTHDASYRSLVHWVAHRFVTQAYYIGFPRLSSFHLRCRRTLGHTVGELAWVKPMHVYFVPSADCLRDAPIATAEGDP